MNLKPAILIISSIFLTGMAATPGQAASDDDLVQRATNPIGDVVQVQFQHQHGSNIYDLDGNSDTSIVQPVIPFDLPWEAVPTLITRTTFSYVDTADLPVSGSVDGIGDTVLLAVFLPKLDWEGQMFGIGPALSIPTASEDELGTDALSLGPTVVYVNKKTEGVLWGALTYAYWDVAGEDDRDDVAQIFIQPVINKYFDDGWYVGLQDIPWNYNDETDEWFLPIGPRLGKVTKIGEQRMKIYGGVYYNPEDTAGTAEWTYKVNLSLLFIK